MGFAIPNKVTEQQFFPLILLLRRVNFPPMNSAGFFSIFSLAFVLSGSLVFAQSAAPAKPPEFDHIAIHVRDLAKSADFYERVIGLEKISDPFKDGRHVWFRLGQHSQLHIVGGATETAVQPIDNHFALRVTSLTDFTARLDKAQIKYRSFTGDGKITNRPDGVHQTYLQDPDGYWIEVNDGNF
jgi:lactoylglutathione lyase